MHTYDTDPITCHGQALEVLAKLAVVGGSVTKWLLQILKMVYMYFTPPRVYSKIDSGDGGAEGGLPPLLSSQQYTWQGWRGG
jgi:hypothetical protein